MSVRDAGDNFVPEQLREEGSSLGAARGAQCAPLAGEGDEELIAALGTDDAGETGFEASAIKVFEDSGIPEGSPESVSSFESLFPQALEALEVGIEELIEGGGARLARSCSF